MEILNYKMFYSKKMQIYYLKYVIMKQLKNLIYQQFVEKLDMMDIIIILWDVTQINLIIHTVWI